VCVYFYVDVCVSCACVAGPSSVSSDVLERVWPQPYICTVYDRTYCDHLARNAVYTPYIPIHVWSWPAL